MPKPSKIEVVPARTKGVTGYINLGRPSLLGNPYKKGRFGIDTTHKAVEMFRTHLYSSSGVAMRERAQSILKSETASGNGVIKLACPCNGVLRNTPCHAFVIKEYLDMLLLETSESNRTN